MPLTDKILTLSDATAEERRAIASLVAATWPKPDKGVEHRDRQIQALVANYSGPAELAPCAFLVLDGDKIVANAILQPRTIGTTVGDMTIMGLGKVCSHPSRRGEGLGARVVKAAFAMVDDGPAPFSLFQTTRPVRPFYERLGACQIDNTVINSANPDADVHPFADDTIMRYPAGSGWPRGVIDLRGPGY